MECTSSPGFAFFRCVRCRISSTSPANFHARFEYSEFNHLAALVQKSVDQSMLTRGLATLRRKSIRTCMFGAETRRRNFDSASSEETHREWSTKKRVIAQVVAQTNPFLNKCQTGKMRCSGADLEKWRTDTVDDGNAKWSSRRCARNKVARQQQSD